MEGCLDICVINFDLDVDEVCVDCCIYLQLSFCFDNVWDYGDIIVVF